MHTNTKYIENITFQQIKAVTQANLAAQLDSFDRQFSGCMEVLA